MTLPLPSTWMRPLAWLSLPLAVAVLLAASRWGGRGPEGPRTEPGLEVSNVAPADPTVAALIWRMGQKQALADAVRQRRRSLFEAAALFRALDQGPPPPNRDYFHRRYRGASVEEKYCRQVIGWVEAALEYENGADDGTCARLLGELDEALRQGPPALPEVAAPEPETRPPQG